MYGHSPVSLHFSRKHRLLGVDEPRQFDQRPADACRFSLGDHVYLKPLNARCTTRWRPGVVTNIFSILSVELDGDGVPRHVRDIRHAEKPLPHERLEQLGAGFDDPDQPDGHPLLPAGGNIELEESVHDVSNVSDVSANDVLSDISDVLPDLPDVLPAPPDLSDVSGDLSAVSDVLGDLSDASESFHSLGGDDVVVDEGVAEGVNQEVLNVVDEDVDGAQFLDWKQRELNQLNHYIRAVLKQRSRIPHKITTARLHNPIEEGGFGIPDMVEVDHLECLGVRRYIQRLLVIGGNDTPMEQAAGPITWSRKASQ